MNKYAVITGAASGIGNSILNNLCAEGYAVFAIDINLDAFEPKSNCISIKCDVSNEQDVTEAIARIMQQTQAINSLVNCAGILCHDRRYRIEELPLREWQVVLDTNLTGCLFMMKHSIPLLKRGKDATILNISSEQTLRPIPKSAPYLISKCGIEGLTRLAAIELIDYKIRVNCIRSATIDTPFLKSLVKEDEIRLKMRDEMDEKMPLGIISPDDITDLALFLISEKSHHITGQVITVDSGVLL
jgi:NAD(P)-dependent dehydrogenase (short-subunit alcohol dehydrogenase family)